MLSSKGICSETVKVVLVFVVIVMIEKGTALTRGGTRRRRTGTMKGAGDVAKRKEGDGWSLWARTICGNVELIRILIVITITVILLRINLDTEYFAKPQAYVPLLNLPPGGPALRAAGTPQVRGPRPPPMGGRGRLPTSWARSQVGAGPNLSWRNVGIHSMYFHHTARRGRAVVAMVRIGMAILGKGSVNNKGGIYGTPIPVLPVFVPPLRPTIPPSYWAAGIKDLGGRGKKIIVILLFTPIHTKVDWIMFIFKALYVLIRI